MAGRLVLICGTLFVSMAVVARGEGQYQSTRDGKTLVWNSDAKPGDVATWSGDRDRNDYAKGFGRLTWYTSGTDEPQLYARYWGRMVNGKLEGPVNAHAKKKTHYAIFIDGNRMTRWAPGTAPSTATARWQTMVAKRSRTPAEERSQVTDHRSPRDELRRDKPEPEAPAAGPEDQRTDDTGQKSATQESIRDVYTDRRPMIDIDDSLRLLAFPPRTLRK